MLTIRDIRINHLKEPRGVTGLLSISWKIISEHKNVMQEGYRLQIAKDREFGNMIYDTGDRESGQSQNIQADLSGKSLESVRYYYVRVKIRDNHGEISEWCHTRFLTALLEEDSWRADFITAERLKDKNISPATRLRKEFEVRKPVKEAFLAVSACGLYHTYLNGLRVSDIALIPAGAHQSAPDISALRDQLRHLIGLIQDPFPITCPSGCQFLFSNNLNLWNRLRLWKKPIG